ncbi:hypothetical protein [Umezawaea sp. NPDC059074]|uniref:hypothetical protein n=1 Tax=Umezawaea sp. NPDC059074 TaxID=3346716 RepID=UPI00368A0384
MPRVLIQPVANAEAARNRKKTLHAEVDFSARKYLSALTEDERSRLELLHPTGKARFWGTRPFLDEEMSTVATGDVVLFTWKNHIRAIGELGASFRNQAFADALWRESPTEDSFVNVFSLLGLLEDVAIPYSQLERATDGALVGPFRSGELVADPVLVDKVISGLDIVTASSVEEVLDQERRIQTRLEEGLAVELEKTHKTSTTYHAPSRTISVHRGESILVDEYAKANVDVSFKRFVSPAGISDMYVADPDGAEIIEAKGGATRERVRQAVAQLLHYAQWCPNRVARLTALFPLRPADQDVEFLNRLGIDCVFRTDQATFTRVEASAARREHMLPIWNDEV